MGREVLGPSLDQCDLSSLGLFSSLWRDVLSNKKTNEAASRSHSVCPESHCRHSWLLNRSRPKKPNSKLEMLRNKRMNVQSISLTGTAKRCAFWLLPWWPRGRQGECDAISRLGKCQHSTLKTQTLKYFSWIQVALVPSSSQNTAMWNSWKEAVSAKTDWLELQQLECLGPEGNYLSLV